MELEGLDAKLVRFPKGSFIFKKNDFNRDLYVIRSGRVRVFKIVGVRVITLTELEEGAVFGEVAAIDGGPRSAAIQALEDTEAYVIPPQEFRRKISTLPEWLVKIAKILVQRLRETDKRIEMESAGNGEYNATLLLCYMASGEGRPEPQGALSLEKTSVYEDIADLLRIRDSSLEIILKNLSDKEYVVIRDERVWIPSLEKLEKHAIDLRKDAEALMAY